MELISIYTSLVETELLMSREVLPLMVNWWKAKNAFAAKLVAEGRDGIGAQARDAKHMQSLAAFVRQMFLDAGLQDHEVGVDTIIPGYYRRSKNWDVVAVHKGHLVGVVELKSQEKSPGNNANNRIEEAIGSASDAHTLQEMRQTFGRLGVWAAWCMVFNRSCEPIGRRKGVVSKHFPVDPAFEDFTYAGQYATAIERFIAQNLYQAGWMVETWADGDVIDFDEPIPTATAETLAMQIEARVRFALQALRNE